jgi:uncharacterized membrane protein
MLKNWIRDLLLSMQAKSGVTPNVLIWLAVVALSLVTVFVFLCVTGYVWFSIQFGVVFGGLAMAGIFLLVALIAATAAAVSRRSARQRAILERAARAQASASSSWLLDPRLLNVAMQAGRSFGWQRLIPIVLLGFLATQWVRERRPDAESDES